MTRVSELLLADSGPQLAADSTDSHDGEYENDHCQREKDEDEEGEDENDEDVDDEDDEDELEQQEEDRSRSSGWGHRNRSGMGFLNHNKRYLQSPADICRVLDRRITPAGGLLFWYLLAKSVSHRGSSPAC